MKRDCPSNVFFCAILKDYDATSASYTYENLDAARGSITPDQTPEYRDKIQPRLSKYKSICKSLGTLASLRTGLDHNTPLTFDSYVPPRKNYGLSPTKLDEIKKLSST
jgi:hypothetical protein